MKNKIGRWFALAISCFFLGHAMYQFSLGFDLDKMAAGATAWVPMVFVVIAVIVQIICDEDQVNNVLREEIELAKLKQRQKEWEAHHEVKS